MNRSIQAFAVLLVSLAGGMLAATWNSTLPRSRPVSLGTQSPTARGEIHCSCNPESLIRLEEGCARDKTTGELYGCGLGLGRNGAACKSVITDSANAVVKSMIASVSSLVETAQGLGDQAWASGGKELADNLGSFLAQLSQQDLPAERSVEQDYSAAELAAGGFTSADSGLDNYLPLAQIPTLFSAKNMSTATRQMLMQLASLSRASDRQTRLWLVEAGLHRQWDEAEIAQREQHLAGMLLQAEEENIQRWFENFPAPATKPNRLLNPEFPSEECPENSRRALLAAAEVLESLSTLLHVTAENLARQAEQDVAELHKLKSDIEERR